MCKRAIQAVVAGPRSVAETEAPAQSESRRQQRLPRAYGRARLPSTLPGHEPVLRTDVVVPLGFHLGMSAPMLSVIGADNAFIESHAHQATPLLLFGFAIPRLEFSRQDDGEGGAGAGAGHR